MRTRKKLECDVSDLETALEHANAANLESQKSIKKLQLNLREAQASLVLNFFVFMRGFLKTI